MFGNNRRKDRLNLARPKCGVGNTVYLRIFPGGGHRVFYHFNTDDLTDVAGDVEGDTPDSTVEIKRRFPSG